VRVAVLGAGVIGTAIAEVLAGRGAQVTVLDMRGPGRGASQASAGMLAPYVEGRHRGALLDLCVRSAALFPDFVARLTESSGLPIEYLRSGTLEVALGSAEAAELIEARRWLEIRGVAAEWLEPDALQAFEPALSASATGGLFIDVHGVVGVLSLIKALVRSAKRSGAVFEAPVEAATVHPGPDVVEVRTADRAYSADAVVIATGSWSRRVRVANIAVLPVRPVRGQLLELAWDDVARPRRAVWGPRCYVVPFTGGTVLVGATAEDAGFDEHATVEGVRDLTTALTELVPAARHARLEGVRVGLRPALPDDLPAIGPLARAPRVVVATGHFRNGVLLAPVTAAIVAGSILDGAIDEPTRGFSPDRLVG
jgi:glycine oxidase